MPWLYSLLLPHTDPGRFLDALGHPHAKRDLWLPRLLILLSTLGLLALAAALRPQQARDVLARATLAWCFLQAGAGIAVMVSHHARFWIAYLLSPPTLAVVGLWGVGPLLPSGWLLGLLLPYMLGALLATAGVVWVANQHAAQVQEARRWRGTIAPDGELVAAWQRVRRARVVGVALCAVAGGALALPPAPLTLAAYAAVFLAALAGGILRVDAWLMATLGWGPLLAWDSDHEAWRATASGRFALTVPTRVLLAFLPPYQPPHRAAQALRCLLQETALAPTLRRACAALPEMDLGVLLLALSLQPGAASALDYLCPALPARSRLQAVQLAALAHEAAQPPDFQRWLTHLPVGAVSHAGAWGSVLPHVRAALLCYAPDPLLPSVEAELARLVTLVEEQVGAGGSKQEGNGWLTQMQALVTAHRSHLERAWKQGGRDARG